MLIIKTLITNSASIRQLLSLALFAIVFLNDTKIMIAGLPTTYIGEDSVSVNSNLYNKKINGNKLSISTRYLKKSRICNDYVYKYNYLPECDSHIDKDPEIDVNLKLILKERLYSKGFIYDKHKYEREIKIFFIVDGQNIDIKRISFDSSKKNCLNLIPSKNSVLSEYYDFLYTLPGSAEKIHNIKYKAYNECTIREDYNKHNEDLKIVLPLYVLNSINENSNVQIKIYDDLYLFPEIAVQDLVFFRKEAYKAVNIPYKLSEQQNKSPFSN